MKDSRFVQKSGRTPGTIRLWVTAFLLTWQTVLAVVGPLHPIIQPLADIATRTELCAVAIYVCGMLVTPVLFMVVTPNRWWMRPTVLGIAALVVVALLGGKGALTAARKATPEWFEKAPRESSLGAPVNSGREHPKPNRSPVSLQPQNTVPTDRRSV